MDKEVLQTKLEALIHCVQRIKSQEITSVDELESNIDKEEIITSHLDDFKNFAGAISKLI